jgi:hypothetical protein
MAETEGTHRAEIKASTKHRNLLNKINEEIKEIPEYHSIADERRSQIAGASRGEVVFLALANGVQAMRRLVRLAQGGESSKSLYKRQGKLKSLLKDAEEFEGMNFMQEDGSMIDSEGMPNSSEFKPTTTMSRTAMRRKQGAY